MSDPTPMSDDRLEEIRSVIEQAPQLVTDSIADDLLTELDCQRAEVERLKAESQALRQRGQALARLLDEATEANNTLSMSLEEERELRGEARQAADRVQSDNEALRAEADKWRNRYAELGRNVDNRREPLRAKVERLEIENAAFRATVLDQADAIAGRALTRAETDLLTQTLRTAAGKETDR